MSAPTHAGRVAVVTGSGRGLGVEIARRLLEDGASVVISDIDAAGIASARELLALGRPERLRTHVADLSEEEGARALVATAIDVWGRLDILVNNAGGGVIRPFLEHTRETLEQTMKRNLWTTIWCCRAALPPMMKARYGRIVNIGADSVRNGMMSHAAYNAAKGGVHGMTTGLAREFATAGITVNTVAPTGVMTPETREMLDPASEVYRKHVVPDIRTLTHLVPMGRFAEMSEVASLVSYVASEEARFITGQVLSVNGGSTML